MSAPLTKSQMAFELPRLSYIDARWEEPEVHPAAEPVRKHGFASWIAGRAVAYRAWREKVRGLAELRSMSDRDLFDIGLNRGDFERIFDDRFNGDLLLRNRAF